MIDGIIQGIYMELLNSIYNDLGIGDLLLEARQAIRYVESQTEYIRGLCDRFEFYFYIFAAIAIIAFIILIMCFVMLIKVKKMLIAMNAKDNPDSRYRADFNNQNQQNIKG